MSTEALRAAVMGLPRSQSALHALPGYCRAAYEVPPVAQQEDDDVVDVVEGGSVMCEYISNQVAEFTKVVYSKLGAGGIEGEWPHASMWIEPRDPMMLGVGMSCLTAPYYVKRLIVWAPEFIYRQDFPKGVLPCLKCESADAVQVKESFNSRRARRVVGPDDLYYIICKRYLCTACKTLGCGLTLQNWTPTICRRSGSRGKKPPQI